MNNYRVYLRAFEPNDYLTTVNWRNDDEINAMLGGMKRYVSVAYERKWIEDAIFHSKDVRLAICMVDDNTHIGNVYMTDIDLQNQSCISHILIGDKRFWGKGLAAEALSMAVDYMINEWHIHRISALVLQSNQSSLRVHQKVGYEIEGLLRDSVYKNGNWQSQYLLSLIRR